MVPDTEARRLGSAVPAGQDLEAGLGRQGARRGSMTVRGVSLRSPVGVACNACSLLVAAIIINLTLGPDVFWWWHADDPWRYRVFISVTAMASLTVLVLLHEVAHGLLATWGGDDVEITVTPSFGLTRSNREFRLLAILAGPLANVVLGLVLEWLVHSGALAFLPLLAIRMVVWIGAMSLALGFGNLLPVAPLDGYRILTRLSRQLPTPALRALSGVLVGFVGAVGAGWVAINLRPVGSPTAAAICILMAIVASCVASYDIASSMIVLARAVKQASRA